MPSTTAPKTRGRPAASEDLLKEKILETTMTLLFEEGYHKITIDTVAKTAGVAKKTIYRFVDNRESLLEAVVLSWTDSFIPLFEKRAQSQAEFLTQLEFNLNSIANKVLSLEAVALFKLLQTNFDDKATLLPKYQSCGIEKSRALLADWLNAHAKTQIITLTGAQITSDLLLSMAIAEPLRQIALGIAEPAPSQHIKSRIKEVCKLCRTLFF